MANAGTVTVDFAAQTAKFEAQLKTVNRRLSSIEGGFKTVEKVAKSALAFLGGSALVGFAKRSADAADQLAKTADKLNETTQSLKAFQLAGTEAGVPLGSINKLLEEQQLRLGQAAAGTGEAARFINILGLQIADLQKLKPTELFRTYADRIKDLKDPSEQLAVANGLMGESARQAINLIRGGSPVLDEAAQFVEQYGLALDRVSSKEIENANDRIARMRQVAEATSQRIVAGLAPAIGYLADQAIDASGNTQTLQDRTQSLGRGVIITYEVISNSVNLAESAFFALAGSVAKAYSIILDQRAINFLKILPAGIGAFARSFGDALSTLGESFAASAEENFNRAEVAARQIKSLTQIVQEADRAFEESRRRAEQAVAEQQKTSGSGVTSISQESIGLTLEQNAGILRDLQAENVRTQKDQEKELTEYIEQQLEQRAQAASFWREREYETNVQAILQEKALREEAVNAALSGTALLATQSKTFGKISKALDIAAAIRNTIVGITRQLTSGDPITAIPRALAVGYFGYAQVRALASTPDQAQVATVTTIGAGNTQVSSPFASDEGVNAPGATAKSTVQLIVYGNIFSGRETAEYIVNVVRDAVDAEDVVIVKADSRNGQDLIAAASEQSS